MSSLDASRVSKSDEQDADATRLQNRQDRLVVSETAIDEALEMTFPASDPVALRCDLEREE